MKVLHLNVTDSGGGVGKAAFRLHTSLNENGVDSWMLVDHKQSADDKVLFTEGAFARNYARLRARLDKFPSVFCNSKHWEYASFNYLPNPSVNRVWKVLKPDILHLHWIGDGYLPLKYFRKFETIPTVATLHGRWLFNGAQHLHSDKSRRFFEGFNSNNRDNEDRGMDVDRWVWKRKRKYFENNPFEVIALSQWMKRDAERSVLLGKRNIHHIPNGLNLQVFKPFDVSESRKHFALPVDKKLVLFGANFATQDRNKGYHDFVEAIRTLESNQKSDFEVVVFGSNRPEGELPFETKTHFLGYLKSEADLVKAYSAADCFVLPSHQDNLPNTVMESLACGTPCVAYDVGGVSDMVDDAVNGFLVEARNSSQLAQRISDLLALSNDHVTAFSDAAVEKIQSGFEHQQQIEKTVNLYRNVIERYANIKR